MDLVTAHGLLAELSSDELFALLPPDLEFRGGLALEVATLLPLFAAGMASRSGMLEDNCITVDDLKAACAHFRVLWDAEIVDPAELNAASAEVFKALGAAHEAEYQREQRQQFSVAELN